MPINSEPHIHENVICANIFVRKDGKYLMLKRSTKKQYAAGYVNPIGGKLNPNENPFLGAQREVLEEAGITVKNMRLEAVILEILPHAGLPYNWLIFHFSADWDSGALQPTDEGEFVWLAAQDIPQQDLFPSVREVISHILNPKAGTVFATMTYDADGKVIQKVKRIDHCAIT